MNSENEYISFEELYLNNMQLLVQIVDCNTVIIEAGRGTGKTEGVTSRRTIAVAKDLPRETSVLAHKSYVALLANVVPNILAFYSEPRGEEQKPLLREGVDYVVGERTLPGHFQRPRFAPEHPEHTIFFANGHNIRLVATDQQESIAGSNIVHIFIEEMKLNKGDKLKSRLIPAMRIGRLSKNISQTQASIYYQGVTGVSDTARVSIGEDSWFQEYEENMNEELIAEIVTLSLHINEALYNIHQGRNVEAMHKRVAKYSPILNRMRKVATLYMRVSTFINRDVLGPQYFATQKKMLTSSEFLTSICSIREKKAENMFVANFDELTHTFDDSYKYEAIMKFNLKDNFRITSEYLKHYNPDEKLELGFDPGSFASFVVAQENRKTNEYRILKEHYVYSPKDLPELAREFNQFWCNRRNRNIDLYYDRAGNQRKPQKRQHETDAKELKHELEKYGWRVRLMSLNQRTIFHWELYKLMLKLFAPDDKAVPKILIDSNECPNLISSIYAAPIKKGSNPIELDKSSEVKLPLSLQAGLSTQIPSGMFYLLWGKFEKFLIMTKGAFSGTLPGNMTV